MKKIILLITLNLPLLVMAQSKGEQLRKEGNLEAAMYAFGADFMKNPGDAKNAYQLASTLALVNQVDTAFFFLNVALQNDNTLSALVDSDLYALTTSPKWTAVEQGQLQKYQAAHGKFKQPELAARLLRIIMRDQALDYHMDKAREDYQKNGHAPHWMYPLGMVKHQINQRHFADLQEIVSNHGWPTYSMVGDLAADALLLVVNHHESEEVRKQYLPKIREACLAGEGSCMEYAKIHDRILVNEGYEQTYGMQFRYNAERKLEPFPVKDPETVDQRRKEIGLEPLAEYLKRKINYDWKVQQKD